MSTISATCERYIGTQGGGMDQAIAFLAKEGNQVFIYYLLIFIYKKCYLGCAQYIEWQPLKATPIKLPNEAVFVIANSLSEANKAATSDFNHRVLECRLASRYNSHQIKYNF